jgi:hypothetical protein
MSRIFVPSKGPDDWRPLLADPEKHWETKHSARTLAHCWEDAAGFPPEVLKVLSRNPILATAEPLLIFPEWKVPLPGGSRSSQNDIWLLAKTAAGLVSIAVEGKVEEPFGPNVGEWKHEASTGKDKRLAWLTDVLSLSAPIPDPIRYQLLHRAASAVMEAERFGAQHAAMLVHSFSKNNSGFGDFAAFAGLFSLSAVPDQLLSTSMPNGLPLHLAWIRGDMRFLNA